jgi:hypothetical protein
MRFPAARCSSLVLPVALCGLLASCRNVIDPILPPLLESEDAGQVAPGIAAISFAVATAGQGHSFFDNHLPCVRRGVATYVNSATGRVVYFQGCEIAPGIVVDGAGTLDWSGPGLSPTRPIFCANDETSCLTALRWSGDLHINIGDTAYATLQSFTLSNIVARARTTAPFIGLQSATVSLADTTTAALGPATFDALFDTTGMVLSTRPNATGSVASLTDTDLARLTHHLSMRLAAFLLDETLEANRGNHAHTLPCGTTTVTIDASQLPHLANDWQSCNELGMIVDGAFTMEWGQFQTTGNQLGVIRMDLTGDFRIGGAIPQIHLTSLRWTAQGLAGGLPGDLSTILELSGPGGSRVFHARIRVDD